MSPLALDRSGVYSHLRTFLGKFVEPVCLQVRHGLPADLNEKSSSSSCQVLSGQGLVFDNNSSDPDSLIHMTTNLS
jgi:hypothetical protein